MSRPIADFITLLTLSAVRLYATEAWRKKHLYSRDGYVLTALKDLAREYSKQQRDTDRQRIEKNS